MDAPQHSTESLSADEINIPEVWRRLEAAGLQEEADRRLKKSRGTSGYHPVPVTKSLTQWSNGTNPSLQEVWDELMPKETIPMKSVRLDDPSIDEMNRGGRKKMIDRLSGGVVRK